MYCTPGRTKKVTASMLLLCLIVSAIQLTTWLEARNTILYSIVSSIDAILFSILVPVSVLVINVIVVREVRHVKRPTTPLSISDFSNISSQPRPTPPCLPSCSSPRRSYTSCSMVLGPLSTSSFGGCHTVSSVK